MFEAQHAPTVRKKAVWGGRTGPMLRAAAILSVAAASACGDMTRQGTGSSYLVINSLGAASGATPGTFGGNLNSDVVTVVDNVPTIFNDLGEVTFGLAMKDPGITTPSPANSITVDRYRVRFIRADGRNTPGVDVPYGFDGAFTVTVSGTATAAFQLVRHTMKSEAPLAALARNGLIITTIAEITFFGHDQTGREASVTGRVLVDFGNFGDPD